MYKHNRYIAVTMFFLSLAFMPVVASAISVDEVKKKLVEAEQLRAAEFSPNHYAEARELLAEAERLMARGGGSTKDALKILREADAAATNAMDTAQTVNKDFAGLVEARDRMQLSGAAKHRADLVKRAEEEFARVMEAIEDDNARKAQREAKQAMVTINQAETVAARETIVRPIAKAVSGARKVKARKYSPRALNEALKAQKDAESIIKNDPAAAMKAYNISQHGQDAAKRAIRIASLGGKISKNPAELERWMDAEDARLRMLGKSLGVELNRAQTPEEQLAMLKQAVEDMQNSHKAQLADAEKQINDLSRKLSKYEGELSGLADVRRKLQLKREAEAKIKRLSKLFRPSNVEILLTTDADVIMRLKGLNFRSGSSVIPPDTYSILDNVVKSIGVFSNRSVRIEGHTDSIGANAFNQELSERRARAVQEYLLGRMVSTSVKTTAIGFGEDRPIANNETAQGRAKNRRIDVVLLAPTR